VPYTTLGSNVKGTVIAYAPGHKDEASVVSKYFGTLPVKQVAASELGSYHVAVFVTDAYNAQTGVSTGPNASGCPVPAHP
jgi:hypothetical protein